MDKSNQPFVKKTYLAMTLDPVHIGTGGYRLGSVDNTIIRESGTNLPKIPGSSLSGILRAYTAMAVQSKFPNDEEKAKYLSEQPNKSCAGKGGEGGDSHCGKPDCEVCVTYGFSKKSGTSFQGLAQFCDARILFFPVYSLIGPVWITAPSILKAYVPDIPSPEENGIMSLGRELDLPIINLGWTSFNYVKNTSPSSRNEEKLKRIKSLLPEEISNHLFLISDTYFARIVNDNLEVRTSVAINPKTGAAEEGALFSFEAIPRTTVLWFDVIYNKPEYFRIDEKEIVHGKEKGKGWEWIAQNVKMGLDLLEYLGMGGMTTRGMGRIKISLLNQEENSETD